MQGLIKSTHYCVFSALYRFSESILEYLANLDKAPDPTVRKDTFSSEIYTAYDVLFNSWLQSRESKVHWMRKSREPIRTNSVCQSKGVCCLQRSHDTVLSGPYFSVCQKIEVVE